MRPSEQFLMSVLQTRHSKRTYWLNTRCWTTRTELKQNANRTGTGTKIELEPEQNQNRTELHCKQGTQSRPIGTIKGAGQPEQN